MNAPIRHPEKRRPPSRPRRYAPSVAVAPMHLIHQGPDDDGKDDVTGFERLIFFSDAVFAIAITLLIIDIRLPANAGANLAGALRDLMPNFEGFVMSFLVIALYWMSHHRAFRYISHYDGRLVWINVLLLMSVVFLPFSSSLISAYGDQSLAVIFYATNLAIIGGLFLLLWVYAAFFGQLIDPRTPRLTVRRTTVALAIPPLVFLASVPVAMLNPTTAEMSWLLIGILRPLPARLIADRRTEPEPAPAAHGAH